MKIVIDCSTLAQKEILEFNNPIEANNFIQKYLEEECYSIVGVKEITNDTIYLYTDIV